MCKGPYRIGGIGSNIFPSVIPSGGCKGRCAGDRASELHLAKAKFTKSVHGRLTTLRREPFARLQEVRRLTLAPELVQDLVNWSLCGAPAPAPDFVKKMTLLQYAKVFSSASFIETGTYMGTTTRLMAGLGLQCRSIELSHHYYAAAKEVFAGFANVELFFGDSSERLGEMVESAVAPHLFWLDGHYSKGDTARGAQDTPIVQELNQLLNYGIQDSVILIDDIRDFGRGDYPSVAFLEDFVANRLPGHVCENFGDIFRITPRLTLAGRVAADQSRQAA